MKKVKKLTPETLKRIIAEEKYKLEVLQNKKIIESYLKALNLLNASKSKAATRNKLRKIEEAKKIIKKRLLKRL